MARNHPSTPVTAGLVPAVDLGASEGVTEIRVHGVGGTSAVDMLGPEPVRQVAGDRLAGFFRVPDPSPRRHVEAYSWGGLTSKGRIRALWVFLLPFMLANLAGWISPPRREDDTGLGPVHGLRLAAARWGALAMTLSLVATGALVVVDVIAYQCGADPRCAGDAAWLAPLTWGDLPANPAHRLLLGSAVLLAALAVLAVLAYRSGQRYEAVEPPYESGESARTPTVRGVSAAHLAGGLGHRDFWRGRLAHARLGRVHLAAGTALVALVLVTCTGRIGDVAPHPATAPLRAASLTVSALALALAVALLAIDRPPVPARYVQWPSTAALLGAASGYVLAALAAALQGPPATAEGGQTPGIVAAVNGAWVLMALLLAPLALTTLRRGRPQPPRDPDAIGWIPPFAALGLGLVLLQMFLLSLLVFVAALLGGPTSIVYGNGVRFPASEERNPIVLPPIVEQATAYFVYGVLASVLVGGAWFALDYWRSGRGGRLARFLADDRGSARDYDPELGTSHHTPREAGTPGAWYYSAADPRGDGGPTPWTRRRARWEFLARSSSYVSTVVNAMVLVAALVLVAVWVLVWALDVQPALPVGFAVGAALLVPPAVAGFVALSWRSLGRRRVIGTLWDVGTFWPRAFHPFAPPCYAERAVPELIRRVWWLNDNDGTVVVVAHSQGSVLAAAAALRHEPRVNGHPGFSLVTFGSPLRKLYQHAFPAYWPAATLAAVGQPRRSLVEPDRWRNVYYLTDYIGGALGIADVDRRLADPATSVHVYGQPEPAVASHTGYPEDPRFRRLVDALVESADPPVR